MPRSHKPRKRYIPKRVELDTMGAAHARASLVPHAERMALVLPVRAALDRLRRGAGDWGAWCSLADALNVAKRLAQLGIASDRAGEFDTAQHALGTLHERVQDTRSWTLRGEEIKALADGVELHEVQLEVCTQGELAEAITTVRRCMAQALAGNAPKAARVCVAGALGRSAQT